MDGQKERWAQYTAILRRELVPALGCTEPIAIAYAAATARETLGRVPERIVVECSSNIIKNVKGVVVPGTGDMKGIETAAAAGAIGGDPERSLEVLRGITDTDISRAREMIAGGACKVKLLPGEAGLHIILKAGAGSDEALVEIRDEHTNIVRVEKNGEALLEKASEETADSEPEPDYDCLNIRGILDFAENTPLDELIPILDQQITFNTAISQEGLTGDWGANVGSTLRRVYGDDVKTRAKAAAAAGSDARMSGCVLPVVINSGSGNQGMTVSLPVIEYAKELGASQERLYRALLVSNLVAIHQKAGIGRLSAYCGAVSAACGAGTAITWLVGGTYEQIAATITNTLANVSGIVCDGAKPSCAAKIASSVDAALMGHYMAMNNEAFQTGEGIVQDELEKTIQSVARLGREGMRETDLEVLNIMIGN